MATLASLRTRAQVLSDLVGSPFVQNSEWLDFANDAIRAIWADVTSVNANFRLTTFPFTIATGQSVALPADFREVRYVRRDPGLQQQKYLNMVGARQGASDWEWSYRLQGTALYIEPILKAPGNYDLVYVPMPTLLANDSDVVDAELDQFEDFLVYTMTISAMVKGEDDTSTVDNLLNDPDHGARQRVRKWAAGQRSKDVQRIDDVRGRWGGWRSPPP